MIRIFALLSILLVGCECGDKTTSTAGTEDDGGPDFDAGAPPDCPEGEGAGDVLAAVGAGEVRAGRVTNAASLLEGPSADGKVGDFKIYNSKVAFIVQSERIGDNYVPYGGSLVDADLVRAAGESGVGDVIDEMAPTPGIAAFSADCVGVLDDGSSGAAVIRAVGTDADIPIINGLGLAASNPRGLWVVNEYRLEPDATSIQVTTTVTNPIDGTITIDVGDFLMFSDDVMDPFDTGRGFSRSTTEADILGVAGEASHHVVGVFSDGEALDGDYLGIGELLAGGPGGDIAIFLYSQGRESMPPGESRSWTRFVALGRDLDDVVRERQRRVPAAAENLVNVSGVVHEEGTTTPVEGARVHLYTAESYASMALTDADGRYEMVVPAGTYDAVATGATIGQDVMIPNAAVPSPPFAAGRHKGDVVEVDASSDATADLEISAAVAIDLTITDENGVAIPGKVTFEFAGGADPTPPDPWVDERNAYDFAPYVFWTSDGRITGFVAPGAYRAVASSGYEFELHPVELAAAAGEPVVQTFVLDRVLDTAGYVSIDTHLHAAPSIHGECTLEQRLVTNLAEGLDAAAGSDHDRVTDYGPALARTELEDRMVILPSEEISTFRSGHINPYPIALRPELSDNGAIPWWNDMTGEQMFTEALEEQGAIVVQINHGGGGIMDGGMGSYFGAAGFDPATGEWEDDTAGFELFNAMEIQNGKGSPGGEVGVYYGLLNIGRRVGITGVSDSHARIPEAGGTRTYVRVDGEVTPESIATAIRDGHTVVSEGPMIHVSTDGGAVREGDTLRLEAAGDVTLAIRVESPSWVPIDTIQIVSEGEILESIDPVDLGGGAPVWFDETRTFAVEADTWFVVRVDGSSDLSPAYPGAVPFAMSGAIFVDTQ